MIPDFPIGLQLWNQPPAARVVIEEGYCFALLENSADTYQFSALAGTGKLTRLIKKFAAALPDEAFFILEFYENSAEDSAEAQPFPTTYYSPYLPATEIISRIEPYLDRLLHDGFVGFGLANNRAGMELFFSEEKVLTCFTDNHIRIMDLLAGLNLPSLPGLKLPSDLGHDHLSLLCHQRSHLPEKLALFSHRELDYTHFCLELAADLNMYPVEESMSFFFSRKELQDIREVLANHPEYTEFAEEDFGCLLLDWNDFVNECAVEFEGTLWEYQQGLHLRDLIQYVLDSFPVDMRQRLAEVLKDADEQFQRELIDCRKRLDNPCGATPLKEHFWYRGVTRNQGVELRRDLIRRGWYKV